MLTKTSKILFLCTLVIIFTASVFGEANAQLIFPLDVEFSNPDPNPQGPTPWATATFVDTGFNTVQLTMSTSGLTGNEFISEWLFNFDDALSIAASDLVFAYSSGTQAVLNNEPNLTSNSYRAGGNGNYDIQFLFPNAFGPNRFGANEASVYNITYNGSGGEMNPSSFNFLSSEGGGQGTYHSAAQVQGITANDYSGWIANTTIVPEPISSTLFIVGGATLGLRRFIKRKPA